MGGESNFLFTYDASSPFLLAHQPRRSWILPRSVNSKFHNLEHGSTLFFVKIYSVSLPLSSYKFSRYYGVFRTDFDNSMDTWTQPTITTLLDLAESSLRECVANLSLPATILRKERAVGIIPSIPGYKFARESLEETVLVVQKKLEMSVVGKKLPFCAFNGGNDVFVDIGDKSWGVLVCQNYFGGGQGGGSIRGDRTLHVGDQVCKMSSSM